METEKEKAACETDHQTKAAEYTAIQERLAYLLGDIPRTINRARYQLCHFNRATYHCPSCTMAQNVVVIVNFND